jgi:Holliday junction resolvase RusA-like endonuclease
MDNITFPIAPVVASRARVTRWATFFPKKYQAFRDEFKKLLEEYDATPTDDLLYVKLDFHVQMAKSWSKKKKKEKGGKLCDNNADIDNYIKATLDSLEGKYYTNDNQIVMIRARKFWAVEGCIDFTMEKIDGTK